MPGQAAYAAGKAFVLSYTHSLVGELRGTGVTATALCPGPVKTAFGATAGFTEEQEDNSLPSIMWVSAEEVAKAAVAGLDKGRVGGDPRHGEPGGRHVRAGRRRGRCWSRSWRRGTPACTDSRQPPPTGSKVGARFSGGTMRRRPICSALAGSLALTLSLSVTSGPGRRLRRHGAAATDPGPPKHGDRRGQGRRGQLGRPERLPDRAAGAQERRQRRRRGGGHRGRARRRRALQRRRRRRRLLRLLRREVRPGAHHRRPRDRAARDAAPTRSSTRRPASPTRSRPTWSPAASRSACPAPPPPGPPPSTSGARRRLPDGARAGRPGSPNAGSWSTRRSGSRPRTTRSGSRRSPRAGRLFLHGGLPEVGARFKNPALARTYRAVRRRTRSSSTAGRSRARSSTPSGTRRSPTTPRCRCRRAS